MHGHRDIQRQQHATDVVVTGDGQAVTIPSGASATVNITDTYDFVPGSPLITKTIAGPGAASMGRSRSTPECNGTALTPDCVVPAAAPAGDQAKQYDRIPVPATCRVTETATSRTARCQSSSMGAGSKCPSRQVTSSRRTSATPTA